MISITKLADVLKDRGVSLSSLKFNGVVVGMNHDKLAKAIKGEIPGDKVTMTTISRLCNYLQCQPSDFMEWIPDQQI